MRWGATTPIRVNHSRRSSRTTIAQPSRPPIASQTRPGWISQSIVPPRGSRAQLRDVRAERAEGEALHVSPVAIAPLQLGGDLAGVLDRRPDEHRRARPRDSRSQRPDLAGVVDDLHRAGAELLAPVLVGLGLAA